MALFSKKEDKNKDVSFDVLPNHLGIIMDGNGRWAKKRGLPRSAGHKAGAEVFRTICSECAELGIKYVTFYAFSTENWKRPQQEVDAIMALFKDYLLEAKRDFVKAGNNKIIFIGGFGMEKGIVKKYDIPFFSVKNASTKHPRRSDVMKR